MPHPNARLTPRARLELVQEVAAGFSQAEVARRFGVSRHTVAKWVRRFRRQGAAGLADRSSAPRRHPRRTPPVLERRICAVRRSEGLGPHRIAWALGIARSTVYGRAQACGAQSPGPPASREQGDRALRAPRARRPARSRREAPGQDPRRRRASRARPASTTPRERGAGYDFLHVAVDDHSRYAHVEALPDERGATSAAFLERALSALSRLRRTPAARVGVRSARGSGSSRRRRRPGAVPVVAADGHCSRS